ncbi:non-homologous end-joining DNA ligase [Bacillus sp. RAR_GA_16]|uniref:non-homologous end-joining DNA ligase n=1 Tax=Bacillus sp. RAR_GA_16 TaxID=2876774 RepID=UPI001CCCB32D|nr:non-homologous end-joining DNA ligase [Bacillus sp. RAR_GA_16]MCA0172351.1 non-homologous end-joining DNA ligase [Bacillus sp. RAR_GA_16]
MTSPYLPMLLTLTASMPHTPNWLYEVKYDGYRAILNWNGHQLLLTSRNGHSFDQKFEFLTHSLTTLFQQANIPSCILDGEICVIENRYLANFEALHTGEKKNLSFMAFDLLELNHKVFLTTPLQERKTRLKQVIDNLPSSKKIYYVEAYSEADILWERIISNNGEGMICKKTDSMYTPAKRSKQWLKLKNWKIAYVFLHAFDQGNGYFHVAINRDGEIYEVGTFSHGIRSEERSVLIEVIKRNQISEKSGVAYVKPGIVLALKYIDLYKEKLRQPRFGQFCFEKSWEDCTWENIQSQWTT